MKRQIYFLIGAVCFIAVMVGCGQNLGQSVNDIDAHDPVNAFSNPFETLGTTDESVAFADADIAGNDEDAVTLSKATSEIVRPVTTDPPPVPDCQKLDTYFLRMRWGQIYKDRRETNSGEIATSTRTWMNWSGSLSASSGHLALVKTLLFEENGEGAPGPDVVLDRTDRKVIAFHSYTKPHYDGLLVKYQRCVQDATTSTDIITFSAPGLLPEPFSKTFSIAELARLDKVYEDVNANHDAFQIQSLERDARCEDANGMIKGVWFKVNERFGQIKGRIVSAGGDPVGHIKGFFSKADEAGVHKIAAKFIAHDGKFKGILIGTGKDGAFTADILSRDKVKVGTVTGRYVDGDSRHKGSFSAIYELLCKTSEPPVVVIPE